MRLAMSNIAWEEKDDQAVFQILRENQFTGLEIAPTRVFAENPYDQGERARRWSQDIREAEGLVIPSMQSIWFGRIERIFGSSQERGALVEYTRKGIDFAERIGCGNLVFGCPRNRRVPDSVDPSSVDRLAAPFFCELARYAKEHYAVIAMEANPPIYHTNYINTTKEALELIGKVGEEAFRLNLDFGTMLANGELVGQLKGKINLVNHVHISEPGLQPVRIRQEHLELSRLLREEGYEGFVSVEMGRQKDLEKIRQVCSYIREVFG